MFVVSIDSLQRKQEQSERKRYNQSWDTGNGAENWIKTWFVWNSILYFIPFRVNNHSVFNLINHKITLFKKKIQSIMGYRKWGGKLNKRICKKKSKRIRKQIHEVLDLVLDINGLQKNVLSIHALIARERFSFFSVHIPIVTFPISNSYLPIRKIVITRYLDLTVFYLPIHI